MREKPRLLKNVAKAPSMFGHKNALAGVDQSPAIQDDRALIGAHNSGNDVRSDVLPDPRRPKKAVAFPSEAKRA